MRKYMPVPGILFISLYIVHDEFEHSWWQVTQLDPVNTSSVLLAMYKFFTTHSACSWWWECVNKVADSTNRSTRHSKLARRVDSGPAFDGQIVSSDQGRAKFRCRGVEISGWRDYRGINKGAVSLPPKVGLSGQRRSQYVAAVIASWNKHRRLMVSTIHLFIWTRIREFV